LSGLAGLMPLHISKLQGICKIHITKRQAPLFTGNSYFLVFLTGHRVGGIKIYN